MTLLYTYRLCDDNGSAPNPYHGCMTLALCMTRIRKYALGHWCKKKNDRKMWVAGFAGVGLYGKMQKAGIEGWTDCKDHKFYKDYPYKLIYLMEVSEVIPMHDYFEKFPSKKPLKSNFPNNCGDNIYECYKCGGKGEKCDGAGYYKQIPNCHHDYGYRGKKFHFNNNHHLTGKHVLISKNFYYFGSKAPSIKLVKNDGMKIPPRGCGPNYYNNGEPEKLIAEVKKIIHKNDKMPLPCSPVSCEESGDANKNSSCSPSCKPTRPPTC